MTTETSPADISDLLRCPISSSTLVERNGYLYAETAPYRYPIENGIPVLFAYRAESLSAPLADDL